MIGDRNDILKCLDCGHLASRQEIELRNFDRGWCGHCGGRVVPKANLDAALDVISHGRKLYRKVTGRKP